MLGHTHALFAFATLLGANALTGFVQSHPLNGLPTGAVLCAGAAVLGGLLPDVDAEESTIKTELGHSARLVSAFLAALGVKHRGLTHRGLFGLLLSALGLGFGYLTGYTDVGLAFGLGYFSHIALADALTKQGTPLLWPYPKAFHLLPKTFCIRTGSAVEGLIFWVVALGCLFLLPTLLDDRTLTWFKHLLDYFQAGLG